MVLRPLPIITNVFRTTLNWQITGGPAAHTVLHFLLISGGASAVFAALNANVTAAMWTPLSTSTLVQSVSILPLDGSSATAVFSTSGAAKWGGALAHSDYAVAPSVLVKSFTGFRGASARGRVYLPYPQEAAIANGSLTGTTAATMQTAWNTFWTAMQSAVCFPVVASYKHATSHNVTGYFVETLLGTQRRRQARLRRV